MQQPPTDDLKLGLAGGCERAYAALYDRLGPALLRAAQTMLRSRVDAEDVVQDLFVNLVRGRGRIGQIEDLVAYLFSSLRHAVGRRVAAIASERRRRDELARDFRAVREERVREIDVELERALDALPLEQREVIALKIDGGLTFVQIGEVLGVSINTAASRYRYALEKLRGELSGEGK